MLHNLEKFTKDYLVFSTEELFLLANLFKPLTVDENKFIISKGQIISDIYFLNNGLLKSFTRQNNKRNMKFYHGPVFFSDLTAIQKNDPSKRNFLPSNVTDIFIAKFDEIKNLRVKSKKHDNFFKIIFKDQYLFDFENCSQFA